MTTVVDVVHNEVDVAIVDASVEAHMPDHLIYATSPPLAAPAAGAHRTIVAGRTCLAGDVFGEYDLAAVPVVGDEVRFADAAGYTMVKTSWFNGLRRCRRSPSAASTVASRWSASSPTTTSESSLGDVRRPKGA